MGTLLQKYIGTRISFYAIAGLLTLLIVVWGAGQWSIKSLQADLATSKAELATAKAAIELQNSKISELALEGLRRSSEANSRARKVLLSKKPISVGVGPDAMNRFFAEEYDHAN